MSEIKPSCFRTFLKPFALVLGLGVLVLLLVLAIGMDVGEEGLDGEQSRRTNFGRELARGLVVTRPGYPGIRFVECDDVHVAKRKLGVLTLGAFNVLKLKDLKIVFPDDPLVMDVSEKSEGDQSSRSANELVNRFGISQELLRGSLGGTHFSGVEISGLHVSRLDETTNVVFLFSADKGRLSRQGLELEECQILDAGILKNVGKAVLTVKPMLRLSWKDGEMILIRKGNSND